MPPCAAAHVSCPPHVAKWGCEDPVLLGRSSGPFPHPFSSLLTHLAGEGMGSHPRSLSIQEALRAGEGLLLPRPQMNMGRGHQKCGKGTRGICELGSCLIRETMGVWAGTLTAAMWIDPTPLPSYSHCPAEPTWPLPPKAAALPSALSCLFFPLQAVKPPACL